MDFSIDGAVLLTGLAIFFARIVDVTIGTVRTISTVQGRTRMAFFLGIVEIGVWLMVISTTVSKIAAQPLLGVFYALGFSTGSVIGIHLERRLALGCSGLRVITQGGAYIAEALRKAGYAVTTFDGEGRDGPVKELYVVCRRRDLRSALEIVQDIEPQAFYVTELARDVSRIYRPAPAFKNR